MTPATKLLVAAVATVVAPVLWKAVRFVYRQSTSNIRHLRGPKRTSWVYGNMPDFRNTESGVVYEEWVKQYGNTLRYKGPFNSNRLLTMDTRAIHHVLTNTNDYQKPSQFTYNMSLILGRGLLLSESTQHRRQNPAFGPAQVRALTDTFLEKSIRLRDVWFSEIAKHPAGKSARVDALLWLNRMTLDVIGLAGFNYEFDSLNANEEPNELSEALATMNAAGQNFGLLPMLQAWFPPLRLLPTYESRQVQAARGVMDRIGKELLSNAKAAAVATATESGGIGKNLQSRDLFSLLVKANMATNIPESQRLSDADVLAQVPTFFLAGHETTSTATSWALYALAKAPEVQTKLREELLSVNTDTPSMDALTALPYLDAVVRESLRAHTPVPASMRVATKDDVLPVEKPYTDKNGVVHDSIRIRKWDTVLLPIMAINRSRELWGPDAHEFKPERWENISEAISQIPGVWANQLSFLGGPRACIGFRFALVEMKALLFTLIRAFEFELAVPVSEFTTVSTTLVPVQRPALRSDPKTPQNPMIIRPCAPI